ncbi:NAD(P)/FAD-dependent oxidoreductase [Halobacillus seohaensis]|uniref:NAD(P)/FAD-dependent oxidoreductase n=1 Tax=Halobacillus seohaensis TaxID=447421 RepID=A0ABW2EM97_9BACI
MIKGDERIKTYDVTIIGAGISGITAARRLQQFGQDIVLVDKGKSVGGRLATRRVAEGKADNGAQFFTVRTKELQKEVDHWLESGWIKHWFGNDYPRYTAVNGMNRLAQQIAQGINVHLHAKVASILEKGGEYELKMTDQSTWRSRKVIVTTPVPQTLELLKGSGVSDDYIEPLRKIKFQPTYVGIFHFDGMTSLPLSGHLDHSLPHGVERVVDHYKKGISKDVIVSIYMTAKWSSDHYDHEGILIKVMEKVTDYFNYENLVSKQLKLWKYAQAVSTYPHSYCILNKKQTLYTAGDAFLRPDDSSGRTRMESAFISGYDVAGALLQEEPRQ